MSDGGVRPFGDRLAEAIDARGRLTVGIDPHASLLAAWGLTDDADDFTRVGRGIDVRRTRSRFGRARFEHRIEGP